MELADIYPSPSHHHRNPPLACAKCFEKAKQQLPKPGETQTTVSPEKAAL